MSAERVHPSRRVPRRAHADHRDGVAEPHREGLAEPIMSLALSRDGAASVISVAGEIDMSNAHLVTELVEFLCRPPAPLITLDLSMVRFFGAHGISALLQATEVADRAGGRLTVRGPSPFVLYVLGVCGMTRHLHFDFASVPG